MIKMQNPKRIVCVLPKGKALDVLKRLKKEKGIDTGNFHRARGRSTNVGGSISYGQYSEVESMSVVVEGDIADDIFYFIYETAEINRLHGGFLYQVALEQSTVYALPDLPDESD